MPTQEIVAVAADPVAVVGIDWAILAPIIVTGIGGLIGIFFTALTSYRNSKKTDTIAATNANQDVKLQRIEILVDGRYGQVLQELADLKRLLAAESGLPIDKEKADAAQVRANEQAARVVESKASDET
jgi:hypothetical protein